MKIWNIELEGDYVTDFTRLKHMLDIKFLSSEQEYVHMVAYQQMRLDGTNKSDVDLDFLIYLEKNRVWFQVLPDGVCMT